MQPPSSHRRALFEIALIFAVFFIQGAWPVPDVNEPYYVGKAVHYWNPGWISGDFFLDSPDTHKVFYFSFGWLSLWLSPAALTWTGRVLTWLLLAWSWRRLSWAVAPRPWLSVLSAALFVCLLDRCHMAGEWVVGGVEAKGFAYALLFWGLESLVRNRWNRALLAFGAAAAFHVLVGGWAAVAAGLAWLITRKSRPPLSSLWPGIVGGLLLAMPGLVPALALDWGVDQQTASAAHQIYVFQRLPHHLVLSGMRPAFIVRLAMLACCWLVLMRIWAGSAAAGRLRAFVAGAVIITLAGAAIHLLLPFDRSLAADLLRYYWFRLTDVALPLGVALESVGLLAAGDDLRLSVAGHGRLRRGCLALAVIVAAFHLCDCGLDRLTATAPRSNKSPDFPAWREACQWVNCSGAIPTDARFIVPRLGQTFKWYAGRADVATWKDVPQDARSIVQWWRRIEDLYATGLPPPDSAWRDSLNNVAPRRLRQLSARYDADYALMELTDPPLDLPVVYANRSYAIYRLR